MRIGVISDTHDHLDSKVFEMFAGVDHILHGGDIGLPAIIMDLETIAPVTAVLGNNDSYTKFRETEVVQLAHRKFLLHHIVDAQCPADQIKRRIIREAPDVVIFGHTHKPYCQTIGRTLYFNPGYAGKPRFALNRSVGILHCDESGVRAEFKDL
jgi:putative phosphoesterase